MTTIPTKTPQAKPEKSRHQETRRMKGGIVLGIWLEGNSIHGPNFCSRPITFLGALAKITQRQNAPLHVPPALEHLLAEDSSTQWIYF